VASVADEPDTFDPGDPATIAAELSREFVARHGRDPVGVLAAPGRVNLIGEHVDYNGGRCLPLTLPHACYVAAAARDDDAVTVRSRQADSDWSGTLDATGPGQVEGWVGYVVGALWAMREDGLDLPGMDLLVDGRVPLGSGLSSSASLSCAASLAACAAAGIVVDGAVRSRLVDACIRAENEVVGAPTGGLDQAAALLGSPGAALLIDFADGTRRDVPWEPGADGLALLVVDTRVHHELTDGGYGARRDDCDRAARQLGLDHLAAATLDDLDRLDDDRLRRRTRHVVTEVDRVDACVRLLEAGRMEDLGPVLTASHVSLRDDYEVSCPELDAVVDVALEHGAVGARMTGGGFGGSAIVLVPTDLADAVGDAVVSAFDERGWREPGVIEVGPAVASGRVG
jgi:galactokinase